MKRTRKRRREMSAEQYLQHERNQFRFQALATLRNLIQSEHLQHLEKLADVRDRLDWLDHLRERRQ